MRTPSIYAAITLDKCFAALTALFVFLGIRIFMKPQRSQIKKLPFPPGPKGWPLIGNVLDLPKSEEWITFNSWRKDYGDLVHLNVMGQHIVIIQSIAVARDLLDKRGAIYSERKHLTMLNDLVGYKWIFSNIPYEAPFKIRRRLFQEHFGPLVVHRHRDLIRRHALQLAMDLYKNPTDHYDLLRLFVVRAIMDIAYGHDVKDISDPFVTFAAQVDHYIAVTAIPGRFLVDLIPILQHLPDWFPGTGFKALARAGYIAGQNMRLEPLKMVTNNIESGTGRPSVASALLEKHGKSGVKDVEEAIADVAATIYVGGSSTTLSHMRSLILALVRNPDIQKTAQNELDAVLGGRLPTFEDREQLPYLNALVSETLRWNPVVPLGVHHMSKADDEYNGYFLPKGTVLLANAWAMLHDPQEYPNPLAFDPSRFMSGPGEFKPKDPGDAIFGFGRRVCPGRYFAHDELWMLAAILLSLFDVQTIIGEDGMPIIPEEKYFLDFFVNPKPFPAKVVLRTGRSDILELLHNEVGF